MITIVGCGALGSLLAARLIEGGEQVQALQRKGKQLNALQQNGITIEGDKTAAIKNFRLKAVSNDPAQLKSSRLIIILVKAYDTDKVYPARHLLEKDSVMLTLQNGLGNAEKLSRMFGAENLMAGTATYGAYSISPGILASLSSRISLYRATTGEERADPNPRHFSRKVGKITSNPIVSFSCAS